MSTAVSNTGEEIYMSHSGHPLTQQEYMFICSYVGCANKKEASLFAGIEPKNVYNFANKLLKKDYILEEIKFQTEELCSKKIADNKEILEYFTAVMRGEILDQFGLDAPISERTKAAVELAKRTMDIDLKIKQLEIPDVKISLDWGREVLPAADEYQTVYVSD